MILLALGDTLVNMDNVVRIGITEENKKFSLSIVGVDGSASVFSPSKGTKAECFDVIDRMQKEMRRYGMAGKTHVIRWA